MKARQISKDYFFVPILVLLVVIFITVSCLVQEGKQEESDKLIGTVVLFRHGDRPPLRPYKTDPYQDPSYWPVPFGKLTNIGRQQLFQLGKWLRNRYQNFLPIYFYEDDIYVQSTDINRNLMSAATCMAGLYPPQGKDVWEATINWQPVPIHTIPEKEDIILGSKKPCPKYYKLSDELNNTPLFQNISRQMQDLYDYLTKHAGEEINSFWHLTDFYNTLSVEMIYNYTLPDWAQKVFYTEVQPWSFFGFSTLAFTPGLARLRVGPFFDYIIKYLNNKVSDRETNPKALFFSVHDTNIANVLTAMGLFEYHAPPYAATILFELRETVDNHHYVNIFYKNSSEPRPLTLKECDFNCDLQKFISILEPITVNATEWEKECQL